MKRLFRLASLVLLAFLALFYLQFGLQALSQFLPQGIATLVGAVGLGWGAVLTIRRRAASAVVLLGTLPVLILHAVMTLIDRRELAFLIGSLPVPVVAG
ncbi:MAG: hypothetical protein ACRD1T_05015, partial [Acidimicrobiia bacterium]